MPCFSFTANTVQHRRSRGVQAQLCSRPLQMRGCERPLKLTEFIALPRFKGMLVSSSDMDPSAFLQLLQVLKHVSARPQPRAAR